MIRGMDTKNWIWKMNNLIRDRDVNILQKIVKCTSADEIDLKSRLEWKSFSNNCLLRLSSLLLIVKRFDYNGLFKEYGIESLRLVNSSNNRIWKLNLNESIDIVTIEILLTIVKIRILGKTTSASLVNLLLRYNLFALFFLFGMSEQAVTNEVFS